jgi:hypothetical protein
MLLLCLNAVRPGEPSGEQERVNVVRDGTRV